MSENDTAHPDWHAPARAGVRFRAAELDRHLGARFRFLRLLAGWPQRELAERIGLTFQQVQKYENGSNRVSSALLAELSGLFGVPMDWFVGPFSTRAAPGEGAGFDAYAGILDTLFRACPRQDEGEIEAAFGMISSMAMAAGPREGRLPRFRAAVVAGGAPTAAFLHEATRRLAEPGARQPGPSPEDPASDADPVPAVLLVDDDPDVLTTLSASLIAAGLRVIERVNGDDALAVLGSAERVDVLVSDYAMVGMDGVELMTLARQRRPGLPGLIVTGFADAGRLRDLPDGIEVLSKPFRRMELVGRVRLLLRTARPGVHGATG